MAGYSEWNESLCGCFNDCETCLCGYFCLPCLFGQNTEKIDNSSCVGMCCLYSILSSCYLCWLPHYLKRGVLRRKYGLRPDPCHDLPTVLCCGPCAICQEARFLKHRGAQPGVYPGGIPQQGVYPGGVPQQGVYPGGVPQQGFYPGGGPQMNQPRQNY